MQVQIHTAALEHLSYSSDVLVLILQPGFLQENSYRSWHGVTNKQNLGFVFGI